MEKPELVVKLKSGINYSANCLIVHKGPNWKARQLTFISSGRPITVEVTEIATIEIGSTCVCNFCDEWLIPHGD